MKRIFILCTCLTFFLLGIQAQIKGNEIRVVVSPDHPDSTHLRKENCSFLIEVNK